MIKNFSNQETPKPSEKWKNLSKDSRIEMIAEELKKMYFTVISKL